MKKRVVWSAVALTNFVAIFVLVLPKINFLLDLVFRQENFELAIFFYYARPWAWLFIMLEACVAAIYIAAKILGDDDHYHPDPRKLK